MRKSLDWGEHIHRGHGQSLSNVCGGIFVSCVLLHIIMVGQFILSRELSFHACEEEITYEDVHEVQIVEKFVEVPQIVHEAALLAGVCACVQV